MAAVTTAAAASATVRREYPEAYYVAGIGWCGPGWKAAAAREIALTGGAR